MDRSVAMVTEQRKKEHAEYADTLQMTDVAVGLLEKAKNRLNKFYNPSVYKAPPKTEMSMEDKIVAGGSSALAQSEATFDSVDDGSDFAPMNFVQVHRHPKVTMPQAPKIFLATYEKKSQKSAGVTELMNMMISDLKASLAESKFEEKTAQGDYTSLMAASEEKRAQDSKSLTDQAAGKADLTEKLSQAKESTHLTLMEL